MYPASLSFYIRSTVVTGVFAFGSDLDADTKRRLAMGERIVEVLKQNKNTPIRVGCQVAIIYAVINNYLADIPVNKVREYEANLFEKLENEYPDWLNRVEQGFWDEEDLNTLKKALTK